MLATFFPNAAFAGLDRIRRHSPTLRTLAFHCRKAAQAPRGVSYDSPGQVPAGRASPRIKRLLCSVFLGPIGRYLMPNLLCRTPYRVLWVAPSVFVVEPVLEVIGDEGVVVQVRVGVMDAGDFVGLAG